MSKTIARRQLAEKTGLLLAGLVVMSFGVALSIKAELGTSPISSLPYVSAEISGLSVGNYDHNTQQPVRAAADIAAAAGL